MEIKIDDYKKTENVKNHFKGKQEYIKMCIDLSPNGECYEPSTLTGIFIKEIDVVTYIKSIGYHVKYAIFKEVPKTVEQYVLAFDNSAKEYKDDTQERINEELRNKIRSLEKANKIQAETIVTNNPNLK